jgi:hypothetical protein
MLSEIDVSDRISVQWEVIPLLPVPDWSYIQMVETTHDEGKVKKRIVFSYAMPNDKMCEFLNSFPKSYTP